MIRRVREMLGFEAERVAAVVDFAILSVNTIEKIPGVELDARLRGQHLEHAPRMRIVSLRREKQRSRILIN